MRDGKSLKHGMQHDMKCLSFRSPWKCYEQCAMWKVFGTPDGGDREVDNVERMTDEVGAKSRDDEEKW